MSKDASKFDPRFDPAFQRGYEGAIVDAPREKPKAAPHIGLPPAQRAAPRATENPSQRADVQPIDYTVTVHPHEDDLEEEPTGRNPFLIALGVIATVLVLGGLVLVLNLRALYDDGTGASAVDWIVAQALMIATPIVVCLGLATAIGVLFVYAVRWKRR